MRRQNSDPQSNQTDESLIHCGMCLCQIGLMVRLLVLFSVLASQFFRSRRELLLENLALRQQLAVLRRRRPQPPFSARDRLFWVTLRRFWRGWKPPWSTLADTSPLQAVANLCSLLPPRPSPVRKQSPAGINSDWITGGKLFHQKHLYSPNFQQISTSALIWFGTRFPS